MAADRVILWTTAGRSVGVAAVAAMASYEHGARPDRGQDGHQLRIVARPSAESVICCGHRSSPGPAAAQPFKSRLFLEVP